MKQTESGGQLDAEADAVQEHAALAVAHAAQRLAIGVVAAPPQLSHSCTTVWYVPVFKVSAVFSLAPLTLYASTPGAV